MTSSRDIAFLSALDDSFRQATGAPLPAPEDLGDARWEWIHSQAPFAILAHDLSDGTPFVYANQTAYDRFEYGPGELLGLHSPLSAPVGHDRDERARMFAELDTVEFVAGYRGRRVTKSGKKFWIENTVVWNVYDDSGERIAQAAIIPEFSED